MVAFVAFDGEHIELGAHGGFTNMSHTVLLYEETLQFPDWHCSITQLGCVPVLQLVPLF